MPEINLVFIFIYIFKCWRWWDRTTTTRSAINTIYVLQKGKKILVKLVKSLDEVSKQTKVQKLLSIQPVLTMSCPAYSTCRSIQFNVVIVSSIVINLKWECFVDILAFCNVKPTVSAPILSNSAVLGPWLCYKGSYPSRWPRWTAGLDRRTAGAMDILLPITISTTILLMAEMGCKWKCRTTVGDWYSNIIRDEIHSRDLSFSISISLSLSSSPSLSLSLSLSLSFPLLFSSRLCVPISSYFHRPYDYCFPCLKAICTYIKSRFIE